MSTTFGVKVTGEFDDEEEYHIEVAFRGCYTRWTNPLAKFLSDNTKVEPLDNSAQGIYTIGDIRKNIEKQNKANNEG